VLSALTGFHASREPCPSAAFFSLLQFLDRTRSIATCLSLEHADGGIFDRLAQRFVQAVACHDIRFAAENARRVFLHVHEFEKAKFAYGVIEEKIDIRVLALLAARHGAEQIQMIDAEPL
jgi:hypothetical protein